MPKTLSVACLVSILSCEVASAATQCGLISLGFTTGDGVANDINNAGTAVGTSDGRPFIASIETITYLKALDGGSNASPLGLNRDGLVVGFSIGLDGISHATMWVNRVPQDLGFLLGGTGSRAQGINDLGHVVGYDNVSNVQLRAFVWEGAKLKPLPDGLPNAGSIALAINNFDQIVGYDFEPGTNNTRAVMWDHGTVTYLGSLGNSGHSTAYDINASGQIVGQSSTTSGAYVAFLWENGVMKKLGTLGGTTSQALGINSHGVIVGTSTNSKGRLRAFIWKTGTMKDLNPDTATKSSGAAAISNTGWVAGYTRKPEEFRAREPFRWKKKC